MRGDAWFLLATTLQRVAAALVAARARLVAHDRWLAWSGAVPGRAEGQLGWSAHHHAAGDLVLAREPATMA